MSGADNDHPFPVHPQFDNRTLEHLADDVPWPASRLRVDGGGSAAPGGGRADTSPVIGAAFGVMLAQAQAGDEAAFAAIFRDAQPALLRYLRVVTAEPEPDDVAGETWVQVVAGLARFRGDEPAFRAWLFTIARHRAADAGRSRTRRPAVPLAAEELPEPPISPDAADLALEAISARAVVAVIATLPPDQAEIIMLRVVAGLDAATVAKIVGKTPVAVRVAAHRGLRRLAGLMERAGVTQ
jgi:RNA polymerase sigma-70 factor (ECF subfamily)